MHKNPAPRPQIYDGGDIRPIPDPTELTTELLTREINALKELLLARCETVKREAEFTQGLLEARMNEMDKAVKLVHEDRQYFPNRIDEKITAVAAVNDVRFRSLDTRFEERDSRTEQHNINAKVAVDAALQAAKEAVSKSEIATVKQIDQHGAMLTSTTKALDEKIDDCKDRLTRLEGEGSGRMAGRASNQYVVGLIGVIIGTLIAAAGLIVRLLMK